MLPEHVNMKKTDLVNTERSKRTDSKQVVYRRNDQPVTVKASAASNRRQQPVIIGDSIDHNETYNLSDEELFDDIVLFDIEEYAQRKTDEVEMLRQSNINYRNITNDLAIEVNTLTDWNRNITSKHDQLILAYRRLQNKYTNAQQLLQNMERITVIHNEDIEGNDTTRCNMVEEIPIDMSATSKNTLWSFLLWWIVSFLYVTVVFSMYPWSFD